MMKCENIALRAPEPEDLELLYQWENNSENWMISNTLTPFSKFTLRRYLETSHKNIFEAGQVRLMIDLVPEKITIGTMDIFDFDAFHNRAGLGILIAKEEYRNKGYASVALKCVINYCFNTLQLHQVYCNILADNSTSMELFGKQGFIRTATRKDWVKTKDGYIDEYMYQLINPAGETRK